ncbi:MAG: multicopper oxidase domain-containing protein, partial [Blastococcus sp.]
VIATDGGFMRNPQTVTQFTIGMAERYEIVIDFAGLAGTKVQLLNGGVKNARDFDHTGKVMQFQVGTTVTSTVGNTVPADFGTGHSAMALTTGMATATRRMRLERSNSTWVINGETWDDVVRANYEHTFAKTTPNAVEIWEVENSSGGWFHPLHIHLVDFQVLSRNGRAPRPEEQGPKDVVYVGEGETVRLLMRFEHEEGRYMIHCHNLSHEDHDMMTQYQVGHHDIDCDSINTDPPKPLPAPELVPQQPATVQATDDTESTPTPETTAATPTTTPPTTTGTGTTGSTSTTTPPATTSASPTTSRGRLRGRSGR